MTGVAAGPLHSCLLQVKNAFMPSVGPDPGVSIDAAVIGWWGSTCPSTLTRSNWQQMPPNYEYSCYFVSTVECECLPWFAYHRRRVLLTW